MAHSQDSAQTRNFLVVVDNTPECMNALRYAARRAQAIGGGVVMLYVIVPEAAQFWAGVNERIRDEAFREAEERLRDLSREVRSVTSVFPEFVIREGDVVEETIALMREPEVGLLVLGAGTSRDGPGPLISALSGSTAARLPAPLTIIPGALTLEEIDEIS